MLVAVKRFFYRQRWFQVLAIGLIFFAVTVQAIRMTGNPSFFPTVILVGAFVVPVTFVIYFYEHVRDRDISLVLLTTCFFVGGLLGLVAAGLMEYGALRGMGISSLLGVGLIEESVKLVFPIAMFVSWKYRHEADGLLFGVAAGMGFAALETMGYALVSLIQSRGDVSVLEQVLLVRGFLSPAGHAAWTGFVCAVLWRQRQRTGHILGLPVIGAFLVAVLLHAMWNIVNTIQTPTLLLTGFSIIGSLIIVVISLTLVLRRFREARGLPRDSGSTPS